MAIREGAWDCPQCGRKRNRGPEKHCAGCGHPRGAEVPFYLPEDAGEITDDAALRRARAGPDWTCTYCDGDNRADADFCTGCGASRDGAPPRPVIEHRDEPPPPPLPAEKTARAEPSEAKSKAKGCAASCGRISCGIGCLSLILFAVLLIIIGLQGPGPGPLGTGQRMLEDPGSTGQESSGPGLLKRIFGAPEGVVTVIGHRWTRAVDVQRLTPEVREGWRNEVPGGAEVLEVRREVRDQKRIQVGTEEKVQTHTERVQVGTERVKVGTRDLGNGYFEDIYEERPVYKDVERRELRSEPVYREEPVYGDRVRYRVETWKVVRTEQASGKDLTPSWPPVRLAPGERRGPSRAAYTVLFQDEKGHNRGYSTSEEEWRSYQPGDRYRAKLKGAGQVQEVLGRAALEDPG